ncbi:MAG: tRNA (guanosine(37)-N1)-methyltransferase TrmD [Endomicrobiaceae bacterium]|jgi:tRNA (guanine37-N1)-methyltransferase|nr:tRNA (guanosine(37)-N1)-methyltransferase TrmD [Endomicrobiaceae bacterium]
MRIDILTIFPEMFEGPLTCSLLAKAREKKILDINCSDIRSFTKDKHNTVDDRPFGGGPGMVMKPEPIYSALKSLGVKKKNSLYKKPLKKPYVIYMSPQGQKLDTQKVKKLSKYEHLVLLCGHYEGIDERVMSWVDEEISIGDYVLTGGEIPAMVLIDSVARMLPDVVQDKSSVEQDSFYDGILDYPHYTRPAKFKNMKVPDVLLSGNHAEIEKWRKQQSYERTKIRRPDLLKK